MDHAYGYSLDREAAAILLLSTAREQRRLVDACDHLARFPFSLGDYAQTGLDGREHQVLDLGEFVLVSRRQGWDFVTEVWDSSVFSRVSGRAAEWVAGGFIKRR